MNNFEKDIIVAIAKGVALEEYFAGEWIEVSHQKVLLAIGTDTPISVRPSEAKPVKERVAKDRSVKDRPVKDRPAKDRPASISIPADAFETFIVNTQKPWFHVFNKHPDGIYKKKHVAALAETWYEALTCAEKSDEEARVAFEVYTRSCYSDSDAGILDANMVILEDGSYTSREIQEHWYCWCSAIVHARTEKQQ